MKFKKRCQKRNSPVPAVENSAEARRSTGPGSVARRWSASATCSGSRGRFRCLVSAAVGARKRGWSDTTKAATTLPHRHVIIVRMCIMRTNMRAESTHGVASRRRS